ncbi:hypothetical protein B0H13DRAFT_1879284 [Mycena leptocephala]|nr:hypothetical protein B0H13DRAFT_1879284 [Mycena leptocephala]
MCEPHAGYALGLRMRRSLPPVSRNCVVASRDVGGVGEEDRSRNVERGGEDEEEVEVVEEEGVASSDRQIGAAGDDAERWAIETHTGRIRVRLNLDAIDPDDLYLVLAIRLCGANLELVAHGVPLRCEVVPDMLRTGEIDKVVDEPVFVQAGDSDAAEEVPVGSEDVGVGDVDARPQAKFDVIVFNSGEVGAEELAVCRTAKVSFAGRVPAAWDIHAGLSCVVIRGALGRVVFCATLDAGTRG